MLTLFLKSIKLPVEIQFNKNEIIMKRIILLITIQFLTLSIFAQNEKMSNEQLEKIINIVSEEVVGESGNWQFVIDSVIFICLTDVNHNRMRIISPIVEVKEMTDDEMLKCMEANFHTALDSKYAISEGVLWSVFIHPLQELTDEQVVSGISQVYSGVKTYGTYYSSGVLSFPKSESKKKKVRKL